jgi:hypothetical protein
VIPLVVLALVFGAWRVMVLRGPGPDSSTVVIGDATYRVTHVEEVKGLTQEDLAGMSHGIQSLVTQDKTLITVSLIITAGDSVTSFDPEQLQAYAVGSDTPIPAVGGTVSAGTLDPRASLEGAVSFVVPRDGSTLVMRGTDQSHSVPLLQVDVSSPGPTDHAHDASPAPSIVAPVPTER